MLSHEMQRLESQLSELSKAQRNSRISNYILYTLSIGLFIYYSFFLPKLSHELLSEETGPQHIFTLIDSQIPSDEEIINSIEEEIPKQATAMLDSLEENLPEIQDFLIAQLSDLIAPKLETWTQGTTTELIDFCAEHPQVLQKLNEKDARILSRKFYERIERQRQVKFSKLQKDFDKVFHELYKAFRSPENDKQKALRDLILALKYFSETRLSSRI